MSTIKRSEDLEVWKLARELCNEIFLLTNRPMDNIPEGFERDGNKEFIQFLSNSKGHAANVIHNSIGH